MASAKKNASGPAPSLSRVPEKGKQLYEGKAKVLYATSDPKKVIVYFKDDATAFNAQKRGTIAGKGAINNEISGAIFTRLEERGIPTHYLGKVSEREQLVRKVEIIPVEVIVRNVVAGSLAKRLGVEEGRPLARPAVEYCYKSDAQGDPFISEDIAIGMKWATAKEMEILHEMALEVNQFLTSFFKKLGIRLVDFKLEFGRAGRRVVLADEITPDGCRLWDAKTGEKLDKDRFRRDLGNVEEAYARVHDAVLSARWDER